MKATIAALALSMLFIVPGANAQGLGLPNQARSLPVEIDADDGIEWQQKTQAYIARGNARARQGDVSVHADRLTAYYRKTENGGTEIWRIDADGNVRIVSPRQTAYGEKGVYDISKGVFVMTGSPRLVTETDRITARDSIEFWEKRSLAVARGGAIVIRGEQRLQAAVLTAYFQPGKDGKSEISRMEAFDDVLITSPGEIIRARRGVYDTRTGIVTLHGNVKITRGDDQLNGDSAEVNLNTGVSRILSSGRRRVRGLFAPRAGKKPGDGVK